MSWWILTVTSNDDVIRNEIKIDIVIGENIIVIGDTEADNDFVITSQLSRILKILKILKNIRSMIKLITF